MLLQARVEAGILHSIMTIMPPPYGGIKRYRDPSICLSHGTAALGAQLP